MVTTLERTTDTGAATPASGSFTDPRPPRSPWRRKVVGGLVALVTAASAVAVPVSMGLVPSVYTPPLPEGVAFAVGDQEIAIPDYEQRVKTIKALYGAQEPPDPAGRDRFRRDTAKALAVAEVLRQAEADRDIVIAEPQVRAQLDRMITSQFGPGPEGRQKFVTGLTQAGTSEPEVLGEIRQQMAMTELVRQVTDQVQVRDDELRAEFPKYADRFGIPEKRRIANIVVPTPQQATDVANQIRSGIPFADVARQVSIDASTRDKGGDLGEPVSADQLQDGYAQAAFAAPKGQVFGPVQSAQGWNVGLVVDVVPGQPATFEESLIPLKDLVLGDRKLAFWKQWLADEIESANIRYADAYRPADPLGLPAGLAGTAPNAGQPPR